MGKFIRLSQSFEFTLPVIQEFLTLDNIYKYASEDELRAIVSSIIGRLNDDPKVWFEFLHPYTNKTAFCKSNGDLMHKEKPIKILDKDLDKFVKELRDVK